jgi:hypothetical protein
VDWETYHKRNRRGGLRHSEDRLHIQGYFGLGSPVNLYMHDEPGNRAFLWVSPGTGKALHPSLGWFYLDLASFMPLSLLFNAVIPQAGEIRLPVVIPADPALAGLGLYFQGATGVDPYHGDGAMSNLLGRIIQ